MITAEKSTQHIFHTKYDKDCAKCIHKKNEFLDKIIKLAKEKKYGQNI